MIEWTNQCNQTDLRARNAYECQISATARQCKYSFMPKSSSRARRIPKYANNGEVSIKYPRRKTACSDTTWGHVNTKIHGRPMTVKKWSKIWKGPAGKTAIELHAAHSERNSRQSQVALEEGFIAKRKAAQTSKRHGCSLRATWHRMSSSERAIMFI